MNIKKLIREEIEKTLREKAYSGYASIPIPTEFNNLKWNLNTNQKYYLKDLCMVDPESLTESDFKNAEKFLKIPQKNIKSIINTYSSFNPLEDAVFEIESNSPFVFGNKPIAVGDVLDIRNSNRAPIKAKRTTYPIQDKMTKLEKKTMDYAIRKKRILDRTDTKSSKEKFYESVFTSLMMYLFCEVKPKDIKLNYKNQIEVDQEPILMEGESFNMENFTYRKVNNLLKSFNDIFNTNFKIADHIDLSESQKCHRTFVEHFGISDDKLFWCKERKSWIGPGSYDYEKLREEYIKMQGQQMQMPPIQKVDHKDMLKKYFNGDLISYNPNADWLL